MRSLATLTAASTCILPFSSLTAFSHAALILRHTVSEIVFDLIWKLELSFITDSSFRETLLQKTKKKQWKGFHDNYSYTLKGIIASKLLRLLWAYRDNKVIRGIAGREGDFKEGPLVLGFPDSMRCHTSNNSIIRMLEKKNDVTYEK